MVQIPLLEVNNLSAPWASLPFNEPFVVITVENPNPKSADPKIHLVTNDVTDSLSQPLFHFSENHA
jgi:hypothetical protein